MNSKTQELTYGAMMTAVLAVLMLLNRQTGGFFQEFLLFVYPLPMVIFTARYGIRDSVAVWISMTALAFLIGAFTTMFYAGCAALTGMVLGGCLKHKRSTRTAMLTVMGISAAENILTTILLANLFGYDVATELAQMREMIDKVFDTYRQNLLQAGADAQSLAALNQAAGMFSPDALKRFYIISMVSAGILQGFLIYTISIMVLRKLKYQVPKLVPIAEYYPPKWTGFLGLLLMFGYLLSFSRNTSIPQNWLDIMQTVGIMGMIYLGFFGFITILLFIRTRLPIPKAFAGILALVLTLVFSMYSPLLGFFYISTRMHEKLLNR